MIFMLYIYKKIKWNCFNSWRNIKLRYLGWLLYGDIIIVYRYEIYILDFEFDIKWKI